MMLEKTLDYICERVSSECGSLVEWKYAPEEGNFITFMFGSGLNVNVGADQKVFEEMPPDTIITWLKERHNNLFTRKV